MTRAELNAVRELTAELTQLESRLAELKLNAGCISAICNGAARASLRKSPVEILAVKIMTAEADLGDLRRRLAAEKGRLIDAIFAETDVPTLQTLLMLRYVECLSFRKCARKLNLPLTKIFRLHEKYLKENCTDETPETP